MKDPEIWTTAPIEPPKSIAELQDFFEKRKHKNVFYVIRKKGSERAVGSVALV